MKKRSCKKCDPLGIGYPELIQSGYKDPLSLRCPVCDQFHDNEGNLRYLSIKKEIKDPSNPGEYMT